MSVTERLDFGWVYNITPRAAFRMMTRLEHLDERARHLGHQGHALLELRERDGVFRAVSERRIDPELAAWGPRLFSSKNLVRQTQLWQASNWDGSRRHETTMEIEGIAVTITGGGSLTLIGSGNTRYAINLTIESSGRFAGRKLEEGVGLALSRTIEAEHEFRLVWLTRQAQSGL
jgi:hypothetical protein